MDSEYIQFVRYKLQKRLKRLNSADFQGFHFMLIQVWGFLQENAITKGILDDLERRFPNSEQDAHKTLSGQPQVGTTESENDAICYGVVKKFNPVRGQDRGYITKGFRQIYEYTKDFNESFGYLVIFKTCEQDLAIPTQHQESSVPFITHNNKTIFLVVIDIFDYPEPASKRGRLQAYEITPQQFVESLA